MELSIHGASAGVAYFGVVDTPMAQDMFADPLGRALEQLLPRPLRTRITPEQAATTIADGISRRAPRTLAPAIWQPWALLRGVINIVGDDLAARDTRTHTLLRELEARVIGERAHRDAEPIPSTATVNSVA